MTNQNCVVKFIESKDLLEVEYLQSLVAQAAECTDWTDLKVLAEDIDAIVTIASVQGRLCGQIESIGTVDISLALHDVKSVHYNLIVKEEFHTNAIREAGLKIMQDMMLSLDKLLAKYDAEYQD